MAPCQKVGHLVAAAAHLIDCSSSYSPYRFHLGTSPSSLLCLQSDNLLFSPTRLSSCQRLILGSFRDTVCQCGLRIKNKYIKIKQVTQLGLHSLFSIQCCSSDEEEAASYSREQSIRILTGLRGGPVLMSWYCLFLRDRGGMTEMYTLAPKTLAMSTFRLTWFNPTLKPTQQDTH